jgi:HK97 family phage portal protein
MKIFGYELTLRKKQLNSVDSLRGWYPVLRESYPGAWQQNVEVRLEDSISYWAVFRCISVIASDISKLRIKLVAQDSDGIWVETESPAFSPVLRKPNRYQTRLQFLQSWMESKLSRGNAYILKQRDNRNIVQAMFVLDPGRVRTLVSDSGDVFYQLDQDNLSELTETSIVVPASEIIHDRYATPYHPLVGISPLYAAGLNAIEGLNIQKSSALFFGNASRPGGVLSAPGAISDETAARLKTQWDANFSGLNAGKVAVLGDGLNYTSMTVTAEDAQLIEQLKWSSETIAGAFGVPGYMLNVGGAPTYNNVEALNVQYYSQCLQHLIKATQKLLEEGLALPNGYGVHFDLDELLQMDTATRFDVLAKAKGTLTLNETRKRINAGPVTGGDTIYLQQQDHSLDAIAARDAALIQQAKEPQLLQLAPPIKAEIIDHGDEASDEDRRAFIEGAKRQIIRHIRRAA